MHGPPCLLYYDLSSPYHHTMPLTFPGHSTDWRPGGLTAGRCCQRTMLYKALVNRFLGSLH